jgi:hypothetical protein
MKKLGRYYDGSLVKKSDSSHEFAIMCPVNVGKNIKKNARAECEYVEEEFPCFIST